MNVHEHYDTVDHHHLDFSYQTDSGWEYPDSALMLVQCRDGRWFLQQEFGDKYSRFEGVLNSNDDLETAPTYYDSIGAAARAASGFIKQVYPAFDERKIDDFLE